MIESPSPINYLAVRLKAGERWRYEPPAGHTVLWTAIAMGSVSVPDELRHGGLAAFEPSSEAVQFEALTDAEFVLGSAVPHNHDLVLGSHSVHTSSAALRGMNPRATEPSSALENSRIDFPSLSRWNFRTAPSAPRGSRGCFP